MNFIFFYGKIFTKLQNQGFTSQLHFLIAARSSFIIQIIYIFSLRYSSKLSTEKPERLLLSKYVKFRIPQPTHLIHVSTLQTKHNLNSLLRPNKQNRLFFAHTTKIIIIWSKMVPFWPKKSKRIKSDFLRQTLIQSSCQVSFFSPIFPAISLK